MFIYFDQISNVIVESLKMVRKVYLEPFLLSVLSSETLLRFFILTFKVCNTVKCYVEEFFLICPKYIIFFYLYLLIKKYR